MFSIQNYNSHSIGLLKKELINTFQEFNEDCLYVLLVHCNTNDGFRSINKDALIVHKDINLNALLNYLDIRIKNFEKIYGDLKFYELVVMGRRWYTKTEITELEEKRMAYYKKKNNSKTDTKTPNKQFEDIKKVVSETIKDLSTKYVLKDSKVKNLVKEILKENPLSKYNPKYIKFLNQNNIISGDNNYTAYFLDNSNLILIAYHYFENSVTLPFKLNSEFMHKSDKNNTYAGATIYSLLKEGFEIYRWCDIVQKYNMPISFIPNSLDGSTNSSNTEKIETDNSNSPKPAEFVQENTYKKEFLIKRFSLTSKFSIDDDIVLEFDYLGETLLNCDIKFKCPSMVQTPVDSLHDKKIGVIDLETYSVDTTGTQAVRSAGWYAGEDVHIYNLGDKGCSDSHELIITMVLDILTSKYKNYTFYTHNFGKFDGYFILDSLTRLKTYLNDLELQGTGVTSQNEFKLSTIIKDDNTVVSLKIGYKFEKGENKKAELKTLNIFDSCLMIPGTLRSLAKAFNCDTNKGFFPHKFVSSETLNYTGNIPSRDYFDDLSNEEYLELSSSYRPCGKELYSIKRESDIYLTKDLISLHEVLIKFSTRIMNDFSLNITNYKTLSGLALDLYLSNFYKPEFNIKIIGGIIDKEIRTAYHGGLVHIAKSLSKDKMIEGVLAGESYAYDVNSLYPFCMLKPLPVGEPIISSDTDLDVYVEKCGFVYCDIIPPNNLEHYILPHKDLLGNLTCPSTPFSGLYSAALIKSSLEYGYKVKVAGGIKFNKGVDIFKDYVIELYNKRLKAREDNNTELVYIYKLLLNSLYGRMGMREFENRVVIVSSEEAEKIVKNKNVLYLRKMNDKVLVRYNNNISSKLLKMINDINSKLENVHNKIKQINKSRKTISSIPIAAYITAYGHAYLMPYKNMKNNRMFYSDTDSVYVEHPLDDSLVDSSQLGKFKLECNIEEACFVQPKLYGYKTKKGQFVVKAKGVTNKLIKYEDIKNIFHGKDLTVKQTVFNKSIKTGKITIKERDYTIKSFFSKAQLPDHFAKKVKG